MSAISFNNASQFSKLNLENKRVEEGGGPAHEARMRKCAGLVLTAVAGFFTFITFGTIPAFFVVGAGLLLTASSKFFCCDEDSGRGGGGGFTRTIISMIPSGGHGGYGSNPGGSYSGSGGTFTSTGSKQAGSRGSSPSYTTSSGYTSPGSRGGTSSGTFTSGYKVPGSGGGGNNGNFTYTGEKKPGSRN